MQVAFLAPARGILLGEGRVVRAGRSIVFVEAEVRDEAGELLAKSSGLFKPVGQPDPGAAQAAETPAA
jgi:acyl-coenzyme A thioesterase PaaI-like protein